MTNFYPLRFQPLWRHYLWGGRRLESDLGKAVPPGQPCAESWELVDHGVDQSRVAYGPLAGRGLGELVQRHGAALLGAGRQLKHFPLLVKFLDARQWLSLQVHPDDAQAARLTPPDLGKTEAWVILMADPGSFFYAGLRAGCDRRTLATALQRGVWEECVQRIEPKAGDCVLIPAGVVHALGPGLLVAEIQQSSDTTYRLFDWNRLGPDGKPRTLHIAAALDTIDYSAGPVSIARPVRGAEPHGERLVACDKFVLDRRTINSPQTLGGDGQAHILVSLGGSLDIAGDAADAPLTLGQLALVPAACGATTVIPREPATLLDIYLP